MAALGSSTSAPAIAAAQAVVVTAVAATPPSSPPPVRVLSPVPRHPCWIEADKVTEEECFANIQARALQVHKQVFKNAYSQLPTTMDSYAATWAINPNAVNQEEFAKRIEFVIFFETYRWHAKKDLKTIENACREAIEKCGKFIPDPATIVWLARQKCNVKQMELNSDTTFGRNINELHRVEAEMAGLSAKIEKAYYRMKEPLETIASRVKKEKEGSGVMSSAVSIIGGVGRAVSSTVARNNTPLTDQFRKDRKVELGMVDTETLKKLSGDALVTAERTNQRIVDPLREGLHNDDLDKLGSVAPNYVSDSAHDADDYKEPQKPS